MFILQGFWLSISWKLKWEERFICHGSFNFLCNNIQPVFLEQVLIFSQMTRLLDLIEDYCQIRKYDFCRLDGATNIEDRKENVSNSGFCFKGAVFEIIIISCRQCSSCSGIGKLILALFCYKS